MTGVTVAASRRVASARAAAISRLLAKHDMRPLPSGSNWRREGILVRGQTFSGNVRIMVDINNPREAAFLRGEIAQVLRAAGYEVEEGQALSGLFLIASRPAWNPTNGANP